MLQEAAESIAFYRQVKVTSKEVEVELSKIRLQLDPRLEKILEGEDGNVYFNFVPDIIKSVTKITLAISI